jgi:hypothetical protein
MTTNLVIDFVVYLPIHIEIFQLELQNLVPSLLGRLRH